MEPIMSKKSELITQDVFLRAEKALKQLGRAGKTSNKLQAITASYKHGIKQVAEVLDISRASIHRWVRLFKEKGVDGLQDSGKPPRSKLKPEQKEIIKKWLEQNPSATIKDLRIRIKKEFGIEVGKSSIHRAIISLGFSYITGRPKHYKSDVLQQEAFKKKLQELANNSKKPIYFFDESRFGTHSKIGCAWFKKGSRTAIISKLGFQSFYIYSAACSNTGASFSLSLPSVDKACMQVFLNEFANNLGKNEEVILVMDNAGWHSGLNVPGKIQIVYLPPYSPELNPIERLWQYIKDHVLKNKIYDTLEMLENSVCEFLKQLSDAVVQSVCNCNYVKL